MIFTASHEAYANQVIDLLDPEKEYISKRLFRKSCYETKEKVLVKDLRIFENRNLKDIAIVDNSLYCYGFQLQNGIPVLPFYGDENDRELLELENFLVDLYGCDDFIGGIRRAFGSETFFEKADDQDDLILKLFREICGEKGKVDCDVN